MAHKTKRGSDVIIAKRGGPGPAAKLNPEPHKKHNPKPKVYGVRI